VIRRWPVTINSVYKGSIKQSIAEESWVWVDLGEVYGKLSKEEVRNVENNEVVVQVEREQTNFENPDLTAKIKTIGKYAILTPKCKVGVSLKIRDLQKRNRLYKIGEDLISKDFGIIWRSQAADQPQEALKNEVFNLVDKRRRIIDLAKIVEAPALLMEDNCLMDVEFPAVSKEKLDETRSSVAPTLDGHHRYKACGIKVSSAVDMAEKLLQEGKPRSEVETLFKSMTDPEYPTTGATIEIRHVKLSGKVFSLGQASVEKLDGDSICFHRVMKSQGVYDCLDTSKEAGDIAVTEAKLGDWYFKTQYFSRSGQLKGTYINFNTPIEIYPYGIRYVDLELDVCFLPDGQIRKVDEDKLEKAVENGVVSANLANKVKMKAQKILEDLLN
jgi:Ribonuclease G/E